MRGKRVLVTGAARGMGEAIAVEMARRGAVHVGVADVDLPGARVVAEEVVRLGARAEAIEVDLADAGAIEAMVERFARAAGGLDTLVNNAGVLDHAFTEADQVSVDRLEPAVWDAVMDVNLKAAWLATRAASAHLLASERGPSIVNAASVAGMHGSPMTAYSLSKAAVIQLTRVSAINLAPRVRVNCFSPGSIRTPMSQAHLDSASDRGARARSMYGTHLIPRFGEVSEVAAVACFLASDDASFVTGVNLPVDGGTTAWRGVRDDVEVE